MSVLTEDRDGVLVITIDRAHAANALDAAAGQGLVDALERTSADDAVRVVVITGAGERVFSSGMDLRAYARGEDLHPVDRGLRLMGECPKPVIAAVNGSALGGGFELMLTTDLVVAADHARFGLPEVTRGLLAAGGGTRLPRRIPLQVALEMGLTGQPISADRALQLGLINRVVAGHEVLDTALGLAAVIAANGPRAVQVTKRMIARRTGRHRRGAAARRGPGPAGERGRQGRRRRVRRTSPAALDGPLTGRADVPVVDCVAGPVGRYHPPGDPGVPAPLRSSDPPGVRLHRVR
ncbi:MAG: enoyl-CoA hydratase-related protein [Ilumatobacteraceae bacterium]